jgi:molybdopterin-guanine dinucleotide biosynthesis protein MobB
MGTTPTIHLYGTSDSGKTRLVERLLRELGGRGLLVATVKRSAREALNVDVEGKDTHRHVEAGSVATAASSRSDAVVFVPRPLGLDALVGTALATGPVDLVLVEGLGDDTPDGAPKIRVGEGRDRAIGTVIDLPDGDGDLTEVLGIIDRVMEKATAGDTVELVVEGRRVPVKPFVADYLEGTMRGAVGALKGTGDPGDEVVLRLPRRRT